VERESGICTQEGRHDKGDKKKKKTPPPPPPPLLTLELLKPPNGRRIFLSENPFGNFGLPPKKSRFREKIFVRETN